MIDEPTGAGATGAVVVVVSTGAGAVVGVVSSGVVVAVVSAGVVVAVVSAGVVVAVVSAGAVVDGEVGEDVSANAGPSGPAKTPTNAMSSTSSAVRIVPRLPTENTPLRPAPATPKL